MALADLQFAFCTLGIVADEKHRLGREIRAQQQVAGGEGRGIVRNQIDLSVSRQTKAPS